MSKSVWEVFKNWGAGVCQPCPDTDDGFFIRAMNELSRMQLLKQEESRLCGQIEKIATSIERGCPSNSIQDLQKIQAKMIDELKAVQEERLGENKPISQDE